DHGEGVLASVEIVLDHVAHAVAHVDRDVDHEQPQPDGDERVAHQLEHLGRRPAGKAHHEPDDEQREQDVDRPGDALGDEMPGRGLGIAVVGGWRPDLRRRRFARTHLNHTKIAQTSSVSRIEAPSWMRTMSSRPTGSMAAVKSHTKWRRPPSMWWNSTQV